MRPAARIYESSLIQAEAAGVSTIISPEVDLKEVVTGWSIQCLVTDSSLLQDAAAGFKIEVGNDSNNWELLENSEISLTGTDSCLVLYKSIPEYRYLRVVIQVTNGVLDINCRFYSRAV